MLIAPEHTVPLWPLWALPWMIVPFVLAWRLRDSVSLDTYSADAPDDAPRVTVIVPARDEARNIDGCVRSLLASRYTRFDVIVVDDHSTDGTGDIARRLAAGDTRVRVLANPALPDGWFGKQWACHNGALAATGELLLFTDADTRHGPELLSRCVNAMRARRADFLSVVGEQTLIGFWEKLLQPHVFALILAKFGGTETVSRATDPYGKIANGQFLLLRRDTYDKAGGHEAVRAHVAEDLRMAQEWCRLGYAVHFVIGLPHLSTRMYESLGEIVRGWGKNVWAAGRDTLDLGPAGRMLLRVAYPIPALWIVAPALAMVLGALGLAPHAWALWGAAAYGATALFWTVAYAWARLPLWYALLHPLAGVVLFWVFARAAWKGDTVEWKGRAYTSRPVAR
ncbi:MAG: glycosyltransferase [Gemmatimonadetes bacterium]|nr:glycosyltransferase [Gemmatimonadota bacterium]MBI3568531.1 glycosyltransferase [Gemmatimonadota bacterium]